MNMMSATRLIVEPAGSSELRMGEVLWSAIRHGGLLDDRDWQRWAEGMQQAVVVFGTLVSVELAGEGSIPPKRWFADPITALLIIRWHREGVNLAGNADAMHCLTLFLATRGDRRERLVPRTRDAWAFRIPGLMVAYAAGEVPATSVPRSTWERVVYGSTVPDEPAAEQLPRTARPSKSGQYEPELSALRAADHAHRYARGRSAAVASKASAAAALDAMVPTQDPVHAALRRWAMHALRRERAGRVSVGYAPATVAGYIRALGAVFEGWAECPFACGATELENHVHRRMATLEGWAQANAVKALFSFERFANQVREQPIALDLAEYGSDQIVSADLVLPAAYERARTVLMRGGEDDLADILTLMFRAGLRLPEALALRAGDVCAFGGRVELIVEANEERALKTKTSRRILPLDVLLEPNELRGLLERANVRQSASLDDAEAWLFGPELAVSPLARRPAARRLDEVLADAAGSSRVSHNHLRHGFASYLLATLLLPQDVADPAVPGCLARVISPGRSRRVADRLLGEQRLGGGALHAVSQLMGHTGPQTTVRHYCHLLDLSLGLFCSRPSTLVPVDRGWLMDVLGVTPDARRKAGARALARLVPDEAIEGRAVRPVATAILARTPGVDRKLADAHLISAGVKRLGRDLSRTLKALMLEVEAPRRRRAKEQRPAKRARLRPAAAAGYHVQWRRIVANGGHDWLQDVSPVAPAPATMELARFVDQRLRLARRPRRDEAEALIQVVARFRRGKTEIRLERLRDAEAFVRLLKTMGFALEEMQVALTSKRGAGLSSSHIHGFLQDRSTAPRLGGRAGWRGSLIVRLRPRGLIQPIVAARAIRFALTVLAVDLITTSRPTGSPSSAMSSQSPVLSDG